ncbi:type II toxin-antitoxin system RelE/ParE family toxin [Galbibacter sp. EGI 63066]|uniref:type II toxin-antitoxin system RelE/ParE family toxin n=1 Tax=Galbibacter sp. EGI 63066 TaxID=2993559 RepID=UPI002249945B|nr:type II toxin-antitoxin system RelE/ParE family toxin [Galbibacter sp. EGI 63066]MCX2679093.1 type II toxin-antitoxin system RelE/ParE family toxin [Galbibacter sp. EGI 63066]
MGVYKLSSKASVDIAEIFEYGISKFGLNQARYYLKEMEECFTMLPVRPELRREAFYLYKSLYRYRFKSHVIFYTLDGNEAFIIRVLGQYMDFSKHI